MPRRALMTAAALALVALARPAEATPSPDWRALAACAAAYRANANLPHGSRAASMTAQVSEVADDYQAAAARAYLAATGVRPATARGAVAAYAARRGIAFGRQPRRAVERFIEACPQVEAQ